MGSEPLGYGRDTFSFIEKLDRLTDVDAVMDLAQETFAARGFVTLLICGLPRPCQGLEEMVIAMRFPRQLLKLYSEKEFVKVDPVVERLRHSRTPFEWRELTHDIERLSAADELRQFRGDLGFVNSLVVPVHGPPESGGFVALNRRINDLTARDKPAVHLMALYLFDRISQLRARPQNRRMELSLREKEVLTWAAQGKSAWEIGEILHIAKRTVDEHARNASRKLGAVNRTQAVAVALREHLIAV